MEIVRQLVDPCDIHMHNGMETVSTAGMLKMIASSAFHHPDPEAAHKVQHTLDMFLETARRKGFVKCDLLRSAFAASFPPSATARQLANEAAERITIDDLRAIMRNLGFRLVEEGEDE